MRGDMTWEETTVSSQGTNYRLRRPVFHPNGTLRLRLAHAGQGGAPPPGKARLALASLTGRGAVAPQCGRLLLSLLIFFALHFRNPRA